MCLYGRPYQDGYSIILLKFINAGWMEGWLIQGKRLMLFPDY
jgi:hypothetical protein